VVGNDIVDLSKAAVESDWKRKGYLEKVFTVEEQEYILGANDADQMVWRLWSMKEGAYKAHLRSTRKKKFAPKDLRCKIENATSGLVTIEDCIYYAQSQTTPHYIHTFIGCDVSSKPKFYVHEQKKIGTEFEKFSIHNNLCKAIAQELNIKKDKVKIIKDDLNIPSLEIEGVKQKLGVSFSHHGSFSAWCYLTLA